MSETNGFHSLDSLAATLGLPRAWLKREAVACRIPSLLIGGRRKFDAAAVRAALAEQAETERRRACATA
jgi:hypothetical protein